MLCLFSAGCLWAAAVLGFELLQQRFSTGPALFACCVVWLCDPLFVDHLGQVRFYGLLVLATAVAAALMIWMEDHKPRALFCFLLMSVGGSLLIASHMLGVIFGTVLMVALGFSRLPLRKRVAAVAGLLSSFSLILFFQAAMRMGSATYTWVQMPFGRNLLRYYVHTPVYSSSHPLLSILANLFLAFLVVIGAVLVRGEVKHTGTGDHGRRLLMIFCALLLLLPLGMFVLSHLYKPVWVGRYMMPYDLGVAGSCAGALWLIKARFGSRVSKVQRPFAIAACFAILMLHVYTLREQRLIPFSNLNPYLAASSSLPLVLQDADPFLESRYYAGERGSNVYFVLRKDEYGTLTAVMKSGYQPGLVYDDDFFAAHKRFLYLDVPWAHDRFLQRWQTMHPDWRIRQVGELPYQTRPTPLLEIEQ